MMVPPQNTASINRIPVETLDNILLWLDTWSLEPLGQSALIPAAAVSTLWRSLALPVMYKTLWVEPYDNSNISDDDPVPDFIAPHLKELFCYIADLPCLEHLRVDTPQLQQLTIIGGCPIYWSYVDCQRMADAICCIPSIRTWHIDNQHYTWLAGVLTPSTHQLQMQSAILRNPMADLARLAPNLEILYLKHTEWAETSHIPPVLCLPKLHTLSIFVHNNHDWKVLQSFVLGAMPSQLKMLEVTLDVYYKDKQLGQHIL